MDLALLSNARANPRGLQTDYWLSLALDDVGRVGVYLGASHPEWKWNLNLSYATLRAGVEKLTDDDPPLIPGSVAANTDPSQYDLLGRRFFVSASCRF